MPLNSAKSGVVYPQVWKESARERERTEQVKEAECAREKLLKTCM